MWHLIHVVDPNLLLKYLKMIFHVQIQATSPFGSQETLVQQHQPPGSNNSRNKLDLCGTDDDSARDGTFTDFSCNEDESDLDWQSKVVWKN
jgi:hypothetical protein